MPGKWTTQVRSGCDLQKLILRILLGSLALAAAAGVLAVLFANDVVLRVMGTGFVTAGAALVMLPLSKWVDRKEKRPAGLFGLAAVVIEFILVLMLIWEVHDVLPGQRDWEDALSGDRGAAGCSCGGDGRAGGDGGVLRCRPDRFMGSPAVGRAMVGNGLDHRDLRRAAGGGPRRCRNR
jgi:hypothetical protein